jgi:hypothetical protein
MNRGVKMQPRVKPNPKAAAIAFAFAPLPLLLTRIDDPMWMGTALLGTLLAFCLLFRRALR